MPWPRGPPNEPPASATVPPGKPAPIAGGGVSVGATVGAGVSVGRGAAVAGGGACCVNAMTLCVASASAVWAANVTAAAVMAMAVDAASVAKKSMVGVGVAKAESCNGDSGTKPGGVAVSGPANGVETVSNPSTLVAEGRAEITTFVGVGEGGTVGVVVGMGVRVGVHVSDGVSVGTGVFVGTKILIGKLLVPGTVVPLAENAVTVKDGLIFVVVKKGPR